MLFHRRTRMNKLGSSVVIFSFFRDGETLGMNLMMTFAIPIYPTFPYRSTFFLHSLEFFD